MQRTSRRPNAIAATRQNRVSTLNQTKRIICHLLAAGSASHCSGGEPDGQSAPARQNGITFLLAARSQDDPTRCVISAQVRTAERHLRRPVAAVRLDAVADEGRHGHAAVLDLGLPVPRDRLLVVEAVEQPSRRRRSGASRSRSWG